MAGNALQVETVDGPAGTVSAGERGAHAGSATIYWWQIALLAARAGALEHERDRERRQRQRVIARYERLLEKRDAEIARLQADLESEPSGVESGSGSRLRSLFSR